MNKLPEFKFKLPEMKWSINPATAIKSDICLYLIPIQKAATHLKTFSPFKINKADLEYYSYIDKLFIDLELTEDAIIYCHLLYAEIVGEFVSKKVEQLYLILKKKLSRLPSKFIHLYILTAAYIQATKSKTWINTFSEMNIRSHELGKYTISGTEKDLVEKIQSYFKDDTVQTSHTYAFILALAYHHIYSHKENIKT